MDDRLKLRDHIGTIGARTGFFRNNYKVTPGLYALGSPTPESPVIVTANYKLTFDTVRSSLHNMDVWILVVDTRGINVWCAAGKGTFSTAEVSYQVLRSGLKDIVTHRTLILPQLGAAGVAANKLKKQCGFRSVFGPIRIADLKSFLDNDMVADETMRSVTFTLPERAVLIPVEVCLIYKPFFISLLLAFLISGFGPEVYSLDQAISRSSSFFITSLAAVFSGAVLTPLLLQLVPFRQFWLKGLLISLGIAIPLTLLLLPSAGLSSTVALNLWLLAAGSFMAMNFTGSTPYTSLSGVEFEMKRGLPVQISLTAGAFLIWLISPFMQGAL